MGKRGPIKLVIPKNSGDKDLFDAVIQIIFKNNYNISSADLTSKMATIMKSKKVKGDAKVSVIHKLVLPRYFGLVIREGKRLYLTEFGIDYALSETLKQKIDVIFDAIETVSFGRENNAVKSYSNVEPPIVFLKMLMDLETCSITEFGCMLYYLEVKGIDYLDAIELIKDNTNISKERKKIENETGNKFFDCKFYLLFKSLELVELIQETKKYKLSSYVKENYQNFINDFVILNSNQPLDLEKQTKIYQKLDHEKNINDEVSIFNEKFDKKKEFTKPLINTIEKKRVLSKIKKTKNFGRNKKKNEMSDKTKYDIGWRGEEYIYKLILNDELLDELDFSNDEEVKEVKDIDWFNLGFRNDSSWEDKSQGKGHDIEVQTNRRNIKIEVKTSWGNTNHYTVTYNQLKEMDKNRENYFLIKINKFRNSVSDSARPMLMVKNNPITSLKNLDNIQTITFKN